MMTATLHTRFAHVWNEIVDAMREEDILSNRERMQVQYDNSNILQLFYNFMICMDGWMYRGGGGVPAVTCPV